jgi:hypothetical protein
MAIDRREQVFVSSTYVDLSDERQEVIQTLLEADCIPAGMELFPASDDDRWTLIKRVIDDCDYYLVVIGGRYGSVDEESGLSFTEMEFDYAVTQKKPVMGFLHGDPGSIVKDKSELSAEASKKLDDFRSKVERRMVKYWTSSSELGGQVAKSLIQIRKTHPAEGWVRAGLALTPEREAEIADLRARVAELTSDLESARKGTQPSTDDLAQGEDLYTMSAFLEYHSKKQVDEGINYRTPILSHELPVRVTWNQVFSFLGPHMMDESAESDLDDQLDQLVIDRVEGDQSVLPRNFGRAVKLRAAADVVHDVKIQLFSLGLIEQSERRRAVTDKNTYWTLTPLGRDQLMRLRALRRESPLDGQPSEPADGDAVPTPDTSAED